MIEWGGGDCFAREDNNVVRLCEPEWAGVKTQHRGEAEEWRFGHNFLFCERIP